MVHAFENHASFGYVLEDSHVFLVDNDMTGQYAQIASCGISSICVDWVRILSTDYPEGYWPQQ